MMNRRLFSGIDYPLLGGALLLALIGVAGIYSATLPLGSNAIFTRQLLWVGLGLLACFLLLSIDYHFLVDHAFVFYGASILVLVGVLFFGTEINNSRSWLTVGGIAVQPSELVKLVLILALTSYLAELNENYLQRRQILVLAGLTLPPVVLVALQGDLGTALIYPCILIGIMIVAGLRWRVAGSVILVGLLVAPAVWVSLRDYQRQRIMVTLDPSLDPQGVGYQTRQAQIAIGSGGLTGKGLGNGLQSQLGFVPEIHTDFIFALLAEEAGLLGGAAILGLYLLLLFRLVRVAESARDRTGILLVTGVCSYLFCHLFVNLGMVVGILPAVGIPLPLLSYGGSSTLTVFLALGLVLNVHYRRFIYA